MVARGGYRHFVLTVADDIVRQGLEGPNQGHKARGHRFSGRGRALVTGRRVVHGARARRTCAVLLEA